MDANNKEELTDFRSQFRERKRELGADIRKLGKMTREMAEDSLEKLQERTKENYQEALKGLSGFEKTIEDRIQKDPLQSILIAAGIGIVFGMLWKKK